MLEGFVFTLEMAAEFYKLCGERSIHTVEGRTALLREFVKEKKAKYIRDVQELIKGKKVIVVKRRKTDE